MYTLQSQKPSGISLKVSFGFLPWFGLKFKSKEDRREECVCVWRGLLRCVTGITHLRLCLETCPDAHLAIFTERSICNEAEKIPA